MIDITAVTSKAHNVHALQRVKSLNLDTLVVSSKSSTHPTPSIFSVRLNSFFIASLLVGDSSQISGNAGCPFIFRNDVLNISLDFTQVRHFDLRVFE